MLRGDLGRPKQLMAELEVDDWANPAPFEYYWLTGSLSVRNSSFTSLFDGGSTDGFSRSLQVRIGGSPRAGNDFSDVNAGIHLEASQSSAFDVSHNTSTGNWDGMWVVPWHPAFVPSGPSRYSSATTPS